MDQKSSYPKWFEFYWRRRKTWVILFALLGVFSVAGLPSLQFNFSFEQFFPSEDEDLTFFKEFVRDFEADDNFLLIGFERKPHVFDKAFLEKVDTLAQSIRYIPHVEEVRSLTSMKFPRKTPFGPIMSDVLDFRDSSRLQRARESLPQDPRFSGRLISDSGEDIVIFIKTKDSIDLTASRELRAELDPLLEKLAPTPYHTLGRVYFQTELVDMQKYEVIKSSLIASLLIFLVMFLLFRRTKGIVISLSSILLGLLLFFGFLSWSGHPLNVMASLYPVIMIIVGTSDVVHIMSKYLDEGHYHSRKKAMYITISEIGLATLFTSITTAIGFLSLSFSKIQSIQNFGYNAAIGVIIAYVTVLFFTTSLLSFYHTSTLSKRGRLSTWWTKQLSKTYGFTIRRKSWIWISSIVILGILGWGISQISTNYSLRENLPDNYKVKNDFIYFENTFGGYRPYVYALETNDDGNILDWRKMQAIHQLEQYLRNIPEVQRISSPSEAIKAIRMYEQNNDIDAYTFPTDSETYQNLKSRLNEMGGLRNFNSLITADGQKARISATIKDIGADSIKSLQNNIQKWFQPIAQQAGLQFKATGTGVIFDKNSEYVRESLLYGLALAIGVVSLLMALLFRSFRMLFIALVPNLVPLLAAGALLGYFGIALESSISIVFAVVFGIAVDDTIHFLSKYHISRKKGMGVEAALQATFLETGKAIILTSIILFSGFMILIFSIHPPTRTVGWLISVTLLSAVIADLMLIPLLLRWLKKSK